MRYPFAESFGPVSPGAETHINNRFEAIKRTKAALPVPRGVGYVALRHKAALEQCPQVVADGSLVNAEQPRDLILCHPYVTIDQTDRYGTISVIVLDDHD